MARALENANAVIMPSHYMFELSTVVSLLGGTMFVVWLGEQITARGVGNGASLIIMTGIVASIPGALVRLLEESKVGALSTPLLLFLTVMTFAIIYLVVFVEKAQRRIPIQYPKRQMGNRMMQGANSHLPLKINPTGVMPPIFASAILAIPLAIVQFASKDSTSDFVNWLAVFLNHGSVGYLILFALLIFGFTFFYTGIQSNPVETADNLKKQGGFVAGIRPGKNTAEYLDYVITRLTMLGAIYLTALCVLPEVLISTLGIPFVLGGTTVLIVVSVIMETASQFQSHLIAHRYEGLIKKAKLKGRL